MRKLLIFISILFLAEAAMGAGLTVSSKGGIATNLNTTGTLIITNNTATGVTITNPASQSGFQINTNGTFFLVGGPVFANGAGVTNFQQNLPGGTNIFFVALPPLGNETNNGMTRSTPFASVEMAERFANSNYALGIPSCIWLMSSNPAIGTTVNPDTGQVPSYCVELTNGVCMTGDPGTGITLTNPPAAAGTSVNGLFNCDGNNKVVGIFLRLPDTNTTQCAIGTGNADNLTHPHTNIWFIGCSFLDVHGTLFHFESALFGNTNLVDYTIQNNVALINGGPFAIARGARNVHLVIQNNNIYDYNYTNVTVNNNKPMRVFDIETTAGASNTYPSVMEISGNHIHVSDQELSLSNRAMYVMWLASNDQANRSNLYTWSPDNTIDWIMRTNPASADFSTNAQYGTAISPFRTDGTYATFQKESPFDPARGGIPTLVTNADSSLVTSAFVTGHDRDFILNWVLTGVTQQANSNYFTVTLSRWWGTNMIRVNVSEVSYGGNTNSGVGTTDVLDRLNVICTSNTITFQSRASVFTASGMQTLSVHVDPLFTQ